jgi:hypothetical protein
MAISTLGNQIFLRLLRLYISWQNAKTTTSAGAITAFSAAIHRLYSSKFNINQPIRKDAVVIGCGRAILRKADRWMSRSISSAATCVIYATEGHGKSAVTFSKLAIYHCAAKIRHFCRNLQRAASGRGAGVENRCAGLKKAVGERVPHR